MQEQRPEHLLGLTCEEDGRIRHPDEQQKKDRLAAFRKGWTDAIRGKKYSRKTLSSLKWVNYGYRMGLLEGKADPDIQERLFEALYESQQRKLRSAG